jgi:hypothetical protein
MNSKVINKLIKPTANLLSKTGSPELIGSLAGAEMGAIVGGISGGIDEDETFIGGAVKGAAIGAGIGGLTGLGYRGISGKTTKDLKAAGDIMKGLGHDGVGFVYDSHLADPSTGLHFTRKLY